ncbi:type II secretion system minor pseudopilin GspI [Neiella sp. HB171785]|uniref:Type II secretion system protein I n=1 Tax=Neiella litorisoli TaxID=2771431 RepID=A0A8J6QMT2_9GAMM|nr:type II secretion system minor pseudopilin GspI [Neiella litorisoli]MBD1391106.1 type II secretion system minor pseudopilin GspI [Neiella litorisoli]
MRQRGLTLIEVLVALAIFSYAAVSLIGASSQSLRSQSLLMEKSIASWVGQNQLAEFILRYKPSSQSQGKMSGKVTMSEREWYYKISLTSGGSDYLRGVQVDVSLEEDGEYVIASVTGFVEKP